MDLYLLFQHGAMVDCLNGSYETPLYLAAENNNLDVIKFLLRRYKIHLRTVLSINQSRLPMEFLNVEVAKPCRGKCFWVTIFFMNAKILDSTQFYKFDFHKKIVTQKNFPLQAFSTSTLRNSIVRRALVSIKKL